MKYFLGIDIGSIAVKAAVLDQEKKVIEEHYVRIKGEPQKQAALLISELSIGASRRRPMAIWGK